MQVMTLLADADGVNLIASEPPVMLDAGDVALEVRVEGERAAVAGALTDINEDLPPAASIAFVDD